MKSIPNISEKYKYFPKNYVNDIHGWSFDEDTINKNIGKLLTIDIDYGSYCSLNCPACFRKKNSVDDTEHELNINNLKKIILDAKKLGLRSVKFLGAGDPFENIGFLDFLRFLHSQKIIPLIFTKGHVIGNDALVKLYFEEYGILNGNDLVKELDRLQVSIMLGFNSFDDDIQAKMVGRKKNYVKYRNRALELLVKHGFNNTVPTRLALAANPITIWNIDEAFDIYKWGRLRNMYVIITPTMISGRAKNRTWNHINPSSSQLIALYTKIYIFNIEHGLQTLNQINKEGVSSYAGGHPCNQVSTGLYVTLNGPVLSCPGSEENYEGNIWCNDIREIWNQSRNKLRSGKFNCKCIAKDGKSIPASLYENVHKNINAYFKDGNKEYINTKVELLLQNNRSKKSNDIISIEPRTPRQENTKIVEFIAQSN